MAESGFNPESDVLLTVNAALPAYGPAGRMRLPLGSVLCVVLNGSRLTALAEAMAAWTTSRWAPLVVMGSREEWDASRVLLSGPGRIPLHLDHVAGDALPPAAELARVVADQTPPGAGDIAAFVADRCGRSCGAAVAAALTDRPAGPRTRALLRCCGTLGPHDWCRVHRLLAFLGEAARLGVSQEAVAMQHAASSRSLSIWTQQFLGRGWRAAVALGSWEARLEAVLRAAGYVVDTPVARTAAPSGPAAGRLPAISA